MTKLKNHNNSDISMLLRHLYETIDSEIFNTLDRYGFPEIRPAHGNVFMFIGNGGSRMTVMAARAGMTKQSMGYLVKDLEQLGFITRKDDPEDKRAVIFVLSEKGKEIESVVEKATGKILDKWEKAIGKKDFKKFYKSLEKLNRERTGD